MIKYGFIVLGLVFAPQDIIAPGDIRVSRGERQRDDAAVAVSHDIRLSELHRGDELRGVVRHGFVVYRARVAALSVAAALNHIDCVVVGEIACRLGERLLRCRRFRGSIQAAARRCRKRHSAS